MSHRKKPERRTYLQDRLEILIARQKSGKATFNELTELDDIVNRDPVIRERIIMESLFPDETDGFNDPLKTPETEINPIIKTQRQSLLSRIKSFISRLFTSQIPVLKVRVLTIRTGQVVLM